MKIRAYVKCETCLNTDFTYEVGRGLFRLKKSPLQPAVLSKPSDPPTKSNFPKLQDVKYCCNYCGAHWTEEVEV